MNTSPTIALLQAAPLPDDTAVAWVHLLPAGTITTQDGRGPYRVEDPARLIADSLQGERGGTAKLPIDENHAIDLAAPRGEASPSRGWIVELQARADGIWGKVDWTATGRALLSDRAYLALSPAIAHDATGRVLRILRASLVNRPNLRGLTALHQEDPMSLSQRLAALLGLQTDATEDVLVERVTTLHQAAPQATALQAQMAEIGTALGVAQDAEPAVILNAVRAKAPSSDTAVVALQTELATVTTQLNALRDSAAQERATVFVDGEIKRGRVGVKPLREHYIAMHMTDAARVEKELGALPILGSGGTLATTPAPSADGKIALQAEQREAVRLGGFDPEAYAAVLKSEQEEAR
ncbi:phage protease [Pararhodobacter zhoushanensis]|uniref:Phage protease n=1 Tax=Pararhodobacter zhoushanensis TaxID=2479545 RepID=A0ABT3H2T5_9RHOB|nr:phage protease [Pararhodobacter zhoushanensis]MCW1934114.1 phage protease [Pararhodobacter zhoushanensis]